MDTTYPDRKQILLFHATCVMEWCSCVVDASVREVSRGGGSADQTAGDHHRLTHTDSQVVIWHSAQETQQIGGHWRIDNPFARQSEMTFGQQLRQEIVQRHYSQHHLSQSEYWIICVSLATRTWNVWHIVLSSICGSNGLHFKRDVDTLIVVEIVKLSRTARSDHQGRRRQNRLNECPRAFWLYLI